MKIIYSKFTVHSVVGSICVVSVWCSPEIPKWNESIEIAKNMIFVLNLMSATVTANSMILLINLKRATIVSNLKHSTDAINVNLYWELQFSSQFVRMSLLLFFFLFELRKCHSFVWLQIEFNLQFNLIFRKIQWIYICAAQIVQSHWETWEIVYHESTWHMKKLFAGKCVVRENVEFSDEK